MTEDWRNIDGREAEECWKTGGKVAIEWGVAEEWRKVAKDWRKSGGRVAEERRKSGGRVTEEWGVADEWRKSGG